MHNWSEDPGERERACTAMYELVCCVCVYMMIYGLGVGPFV